MNYMFFKAVFIISILVILYTYVLYPLIIWAMSVLFNRPVKKADILPSVSIVIAAYNEEASIERKIHNCLELDYPEEKLEILIGSDGSSDRTNEILDKNSSERVRCYKFSSREGKVNVLNRIVAEARGEIIVFADARQVFENNAILELVRNFADTSIGCVSGALILKNSGTNKFGDSLGAYWKYEKFIRKCESSVDSMIGATGAIYAIRKDLFTRSDSDTLLDDVFIPLMTVKKGFRSIFEQLAVAYDEVSTSRETESRRKVRTLAGNWQIFFKCSDMLNPFASRIAFQLISHKVLRVVVPFFLILAFASNIFALNEHLYVFIFILQVFFYLCALFGSKLIGSELKLFTIPYAFCALNIDALKGMLFYFNRSQKVTWVK